MVVQLEEAFFRKMYKLCDQMDAVLSNIDKHLDDLDKLDEEEQVTIRPKLRLVK
jgi:hypothetical protein